MFSTVLGFPDSRVIVPFLRRRPLVFSQVKVKMNLKWLIVMLDNKLSVIRLYLFCFLLAFCLGGKMWWKTRNEMEDRNVRFSMKRKGQYTAHVFSCEFCEIFKKTFFQNIAQLIILSYPTTLWKMFPFKNNHAIFSFSSTIHGNTDTVHLIEGFVF